MIVFKISFYEYKYSDFFKYKKYHRYDGASLLSTKSNNKDYSTIDCRCFLDFSSYKKMNKASNFNNSSSLEKDVI